MNWKENWKINHNNKNRLFIVYGLEIIILQEIEAREFCFFEFLYLAPDLVIKDK